MRKVSCCSTVDHGGQYLDIEPDLRHAPLNISESGCNAKKKVCEYTAREVARQGGIGRDGESESEEGRCNMSPMRMHETLVFAETAKHLAQRMSELREFDFIPLTRAARYLLGES